MSGAIPLHPNTPLRRGAHLKSTGTTLPLPYQKMLQINGVDVNAIQVLYLASVFVKQSSLRVHISRYLFDAFPFQNGLKQGDALPPLLFTAFFTSIALPWT
jgi:hypothetical protein